MKHLVLLGTLSALLFLTACAEAQFGAHMAKQIGKDDRSQAKYKVGKPYLIDGQEYYPQENFNYSETGIASWYGPGFHGKNTANGETYDSNDLTAAHKTLQMPSLVRVTNLENGRSIVVRVNDRGPMVGDRLIDLSRGAAEQLGLTDAVAAVRVRRTNPPVAERAQLRAGRPVPERIATPESLLSILRTKAKALPVPKSAAPIAAQPAAPVASGKGKPGDDRFVVEGPDTTKAPPKPAPAAKPTPAAKPAGTAAKPAPAIAGKYVVQVGAFSSEARANAAAKSVGGHVSKAGNLWRVRVGPFASEAKASGALGTAKSKGFRDAVVQRDR